MVDVCGHCQLSSSMQSSASRQLDFYGALASARSAVHDFKLEVQANCLDCDSSPVPRRAAATHQMSLLLLCAMS